MLDSLISAAIIGAMFLTRRAFAKATLGAGSALSGLAMAGELRTTALGQTLPAANGSLNRSLNRSLINGVQFALEPFCYHDLVMSRENRGELIRRFVRNGFGMAEVHATWVEPNFAASGVPPAEAREQLRRWRVSATDAYYLDVKKEFDEAGVAICAYFTQLNESYTDEEVDATFRAARLLGAKGCVGSYGLARAKHLSTFPGKHQLFLGLHNHDNLSDPDAFSNEASLVKGLAYGPDVKAVLDVRHFVAGNGDCLAFLERHHAQTVAVHLGDRRRNNGRSTPFGEGDAPIIEILRMLRDNQWPITVVIEFEHGTLRPAVEEVDLMFDYCKRAIA